MKERKSKGVDSTCGNTHVGHLSGSMAWDFETQRVVSDTDGAGAERKPGLLGGRSQGLEEGMPLSSWAGGKRVCFTVQTVGWQGDSLGAGHL